MTTAASCCAFDDEDRRLVATGGSAAPLPSKRTSSGSSSSGRAGAGARRSRRTRRPRARRRSGGSRRWARPRAPPSRGSRRRRGGRRRTARAAPRSSAAPRRPPAPAVRLGPSRRRRRARSRASSAAACAVIAVLPTRLPVPTIPIEGSGNGSSAGGSKRKSAPTYGNAVARAPGSRPGSARRGPSTGSSERSTHDLGRDARRARVERVRERDAVVLVAAQLLAAAEQVCGDEVVRELLERRADDRRVVLAVDEGQSTLASRPRRHLVLDPAGVLLVLERVERELDDPLLAVERVLAPDVDVRCRRPRRRCNRASCCPEAAATRPCRC